MRYCCAELKENGGKGRLRVTGVRKAESTDKWKTAEDVYCWWVGIDRNQITIEDYFGTKEEKE